MLALQGYGVLLYDAQGRGESEGSPNAQGWTWQADVSAALDFLSQREDADRSRIGGWVCPREPMSSSRLLQRTPRLKAVVTARRLNHSFRSRMFAG